MIKLKGLSVEEVESCFPYNPILVGYRGSIAHGTYVPNKDPNSIDDKDIMGVIVGKKEHYLGLDEFKHKEAFIREWDIVNYEIRKYFRLLLKSNPNVLSLLWIEPRNYIYIHPNGQSIIDNRDIFVSKNIFRSFTGYAHGQLHRMTHHSYKGYMGEKRKALVDKYGYDCKNATHLIRILRMGIEFLNEGILYVHRHDAQELLEIKRGEWSLERVQREADYLFKRADKAMDRCTLPAEPNYADANELLCSIIKYWI